VLADLRQQVEEAAALLRVEPGGGLVDDDEPRIAQQGLRDAEALPHAAREPAELLLALVPEVHPLKQRLDHRLALAPSGDALEHREVIEQRQGAQVRIDPEVLREVAQHLPQPVLVAQHVDLPQPDAALVRVLQRGDGAHERGLARPIGPQQPEHARRNRQVDPPQCPNVARVGLGEALDDELGALVAAHGGAMTPFVFGGFLDDA